ncbi:hypothetical protein N7931_13815 [Catenovulum sp. 2E275]|uniref:hypothetical protein n=1 Tax=Catenovulum sp. 2E275 TaxID=2980497 RepID=UPI0021D27E3C|nr:hypothetical protein [Catenovulum sp. 2E275]MCU4676708.1 hypothetical protein [Catenovulum sp. 2E275]
MMNIEMSQETYPSKIAGVFNSEESAQAVVKALHSKTDLSPDKVSLIQPGDMHFDEKLEPEDKQIGKTLLKTHITFGCIGLIFGLCIATLLNLTGFVLMQNYLIEAFVSISLICLFLGLLVAGFVTIRPDHDSMINKIRTATRSGQWSVIVHLPDSSKMEEVKKVMQPLASSLTATL